MRTLTIIIVALALSAPAMAGPLDDGLAALDRRDYATAFRLLSPLAESGNPDAQINLANMYFDGNGVLRNYAAGVKWYLLAAGSGSADAKIALGFLYQYGDAVPLDYVQAYKWFELAGADADMYRDAVAAVMTPAQIAEAQKLAREWKPN